jgi:Flp pilus assembly protein TadG
MPTYRRHRLAKRLLSFKSSSAGVAAIEFAYILPVLMMMTFGVIEATRAVIMHKRFQRSVALISDLVSREETLGTNVASADAALAGIMKAAEHTMSPYSAASLKIGVSAISANSNPAITATTVAWKYSYHSYPMTACGGTKAMPATGMIAAGNSAILVEADYTFTPLLGDLVPGFKTAVTWHDTIANAPRGSCPNYAGLQCLTCP